MADTRRGKLLHETGLVPIYYFPLCDVREDLLLATSHTTHCPFKGDASYWSVRVGEREAEHAVWGYRTPLEIAPPIAEYVAFYWKKMDRWFEEDAEAFVHARDPYHRVDVMPASRRVVVTLQGIVLADSSRPRIVYETGLPPRYYLPREDVAMARLAPSQTRTRCPYKGRTSAYWNFEGRDGTLEDVAWAYDEPLPAATGLVGYIGFDDQQATLTLDPGLSP